MNILYVLSGLWAIDAVVGRYFAGTWTTETYISTAASLFLVAMAEIVETLKKIEKKL